MPQLPLNLRSLLTLPGNRPSSSLREFFDSLSPYRPPLGLLSDELWRQPVADPYAVPPRREPDRVTWPDLFPRSSVRNLVHDRGYGGRPPPTPPRRNAGGVATAGNPMEASGDEDNALPDAVVNSFRESLDRGGLDFLKHGPRTSAERLAFAQRVHPDAHMSAKLVPDPTRNGVRDARGLDSARHFVGPDGRLYRRDETSASGYRATR